MTSLERKRGPYTISTDPARLDGAAIHAFLTRSYWSPGIPRHIVEAALTASLCFGLYDGPRQIGLARVITDRATFGYLATSTSWRTIAARVSASG